MLSRQVAKTVWFSLLLFVVGSVGLAFCGFYVAKADTKLFNDSSKVIIARDGERTILSMANDFKGDVNEFAMVVPIPYVFTESQIQVGDPLIFERIDAYSAPRLVEYFDEDPCNTVLYEMDTRQMAVPAPTAAAGLEVRAKSLGVTIEEQFTVGEYDILILSAEESAGLETWLLENGYNLPQGASEALAPYIAGGMNFFVAKVNLEAFAETGFKQLRPLMMAFESEDFMLPIQLGMVNANGPQDLLVYLLSPEGRVELANYQTVKLPSDMTLPEFVEDEFADTYRALFQTTWEREGKNVGVLEYAWDMAWCDPCAAEPLNERELAGAGVFWLGDGSDFNAPNVYLTRLHIRYDAEHFDKDLMFKVTDNRENFQGRYILKRPFAGEITCKEGEGYVNEVRERQKDEAKRLANLTGWEYSDILAKIEPYQPEVNVPNWWERVFDSLN